ncbi:MAG: hypothetical protein V4695_12100 [Pseudomonadota bacterium]
MYLDHPRISATNSEVEFDRIERLNRVYGYAIALADVDENRQCITKLVHLHDHKGVLRVIWRSAPTMPESAYFHRAWKSLIGDGSDNVEHVLEGSQESEA